MFEKFGHDFYINFIKDDRYTWLLDGLKNTMIITVFALTDICGNSIQNLIGSKRFFQILYLDQNFTLINAHWFSVSSPVYS